MLELLWGLPTSQEVLRPSKPRLSLYSTRMNLEALQGLNLTFSTPSARRSRRVFIGGLSRCLDQSWGSRGPLVKPASHLTWLGGQALWQHRLSHIGYPSCQLKLTRVEDGFRKDTKSWPAGRPHFGSAGPRLCATLSPCIILSVTTPGFGHNEDIYGFWSIWCFSVIRCSENGKSTKLVKLVSNKHLSSISWMKYRYVGGKYMHFMTANTPLPHTLRILLVPEQKKRIKS
jgi:hypothetical protein